VLATSTWRAWLPSHTPSPRTFLRTLLDRPAQDRPFLLIPLGYPADDRQVPDIQRKPLEAISLWR